MRPTQALSVGRYRHLKLTTKDVGKGFYKGNRTGSMGRHTKCGGYVIEWNKVRTYAVPNLKDFKVRRELRTWRTTVANAHGVAHAVCEPPSQG
jgi:large subunit ribosomal protein L41